MIEKPFGTRPRLRQGAQPAHPRMSWTSSRSTASTISWARRRSRTSWSLRFANGVFEPLWNRAAHRSRADHRRGDGRRRGARRLLRQRRRACATWCRTTCSSCWRMTAMEPPNSFDADAVRAEAGRVLEAVPPQSPERGAGRSVRGAVSRRRGAGPRAVADYRARAQRRSPQPHRDLRRAEAGDRQLALGGRAVLPAHRQGAGGAATPRSRSASSRRRGACSATPRSTGPPPNAGPADPARRRRIAGSSRPKRPGRRCSSSRCAMDFRYADFFEAQPSTGYETLIYDCMIGDQTLFQRADEIEFGWRAVQPFLDAWRTAGKCTATRRARTVRARPTRCWLGTAGPGASSDHDLAPPPAGGSFDPGRRFRPAGRRGPRSRRRRRGLDPPRHHGRSVRAQHQLRAGCGPGHPAMHGKAAERPSDDRGAGTLPGNLRRGRRRPSAGPGRIRARRSTCIAC